VPNHARDFSLAHAHSADRSGRHWRPGRRRVSHSGDGAVFALLHGRTLTGAGPDKWCRLYGE